MLSHECSRTRGPEQRKAERSESYGTPPGTLLVQPLSDLLKQKQKNVFIKAFGTLC